MDYTASQHWTFTIIGLLLLVIIVFTFRGETSFLKQSRNQSVQFVLSLISIAVMVFLTLVLLFHWSLEPVVTITALMLLTPLLLVLAPIIMYLRFKTFRSMFRNRIDERNKLINEVQDLLDEKKREKIREGKVKRGESPE